MPTLLFDCLAKQLTMRKRKHVQEEKPMDYEEEKKAFEKLGMKYGKDFNEETIDELTNGKGEDEDE